MEMFRRIKNTVLILFAGGCIGLILLVLVNTIPTDSMIKNARASVDIFKIEGTHPQVIHGYQATTLDNYTDAWMFRNAFYNGDESSWQKALNVYYYGYLDGETNDVCESMIAWLAGKEGYERLSYARYWHGYLTILKPLLFFWDYGDIRGLFKFIELALLIYVCVLLNKRQLTHFIPAFTAAMICIEFQVIGMSLQYSWVFMIAMLFSIAILRQYPYGMEKFFGGACFLIIGMMTSYFDFLTYPLFTLGMPLLFLIICEKGENKNSPPIVFTVFKNSVYWAVGYIGMWVQKWIYCTVFTGENLIADGVQAVVNRSSREVNGEQIRYWQTLRVNMAPLCKYPYVIAVLAAAIIIFFLCKKNDKGTFSKDAFIAYLYVAILPFGWYAISINHSYIHSFMTYKSLGITVFAGLCILTELGKVSWKKFWGKKLI